MILHDLLERGRSTGVIQVELGFRRDAVALRQTSTVEKEPSRARPTRPPSCTFSACWRDSTREQISELNHAQIFPQRLERRQRRDAQAQEGDLEERQR